MMRLMHVVTAARTTGIWRHPFARMMTTITSATTTMTMSTDYYRTRVGVNEPSISERIHPVVWSKDTRNDSLAAYERDGFIIFERMFDASAVRKLLDECTALCESTDHPPVAETGDDNIVKSVFAPHEHSALVRALFEYAPLVEFAQSVVNSQVYIHQGRVNFQAAFDGKGFNWHSDFETWHIEDGMPLPRALSCVLMLSDNTDYNGPLFVVPGSHKRFIACVGETPQENWKQSLRYQNEAGVPDRRTIAELATQNGIHACKAPAGSVLFFDCNLLHGSSNNVSPFQRTNIFAVYNATSNALTTPAQPPRPQYIANRRDYTPLVASERRLHDLLEEKDEE